MLNLWAIVIVVVIIQLLGRGFIANYYQKDVVTSGNSKSSVVFIDKQYDWNKVDESIVAAIKNANTTAENFISQNHVLFDIIFFDPPFQDKNQISLLPLLKKHLAPDGLIYFESDNKFEEEQKRKCHPQIQLVHCQTTSSKLRASEGQ